MFKIKAGQVWKNNDTRNVFSSFTITKITSRYVYGKYRLGDTKTCILKSRLVNAPKDNRGYTFVKEGK